MVTKLRLFVKEYMDILFTAIGTLGVSSAFALFVTGYSGTSDLIYLFRWLSLVLLLVGILFYSLAAKVIRSKEKETKREREQASREAEAREQHEAEREKREIERAKQEQIKFKYWADSHPDEYTKEG